MNYEVSLPRAHPEVADRKTCTAENPMPKGDNGRWVHVGRETSYDGDHYIEYECLYCGHIFRTGMPD